MTYTPRPLDTSLVTLSPEIEELVETLARNNHELWSRRRIAEGWSYGPTRDDGAKTHPCLIPYEELPESEKEYDRQAAIGTLSAIVAAGFAVERRR